MKRLIFKQLIAWKENSKRKPLIIKGARQVGKTYILKHFGETSSFEDVHYFNFEKEPKLAEAFEISLDPKKILQNLSFERQRKIDYKKELIIFDEIQSCPNALTSLKYFAEELPGSFVCSAGSLLGIYLGPVSFPVGKVEHLQMFPVSFIEFLMAAGDNLSVDLLQNLTPQTQIPATAHRHLWERLKHYFVVGGLPEVVSLYLENQDNLFSNFNKVREKQLELIEDYFSDIAKHSGKINAMHINRIWRNIPEQLSRTLDGGASKYRFKDVISGIDRFSKLAGAIDWLEAAGLIIKVHIINRGTLPFNSYIKENSFKLFLFDIGLLGAMSELNPKTILDYDYGSYKGYFAENYVAQAFRSSHPDQLYSWTEKTSEVEFLRQINGEVVPIEVKSGWTTQAKSLKVFNEKYAPSFRVIMSAKPYHIDTCNKAHHYPLYLAAQFPITTSH